MSQGGGGGGVEGRARCLRFRGSKVGRQKLTNRERSWPTSEQLQAQTQAIERPNPGPNSSLPTAQSLRNSNPMKCDHPTNKRMPNGQQLTSPASATATAAAAAKASKLNSLALRLLLVALCLTLAQQASLCSRCLALASGEQPAAPPPQSGQQLEREFAPKSSTGGGGASDANDDTSKRADSVAKLEAPRETLMSAESAQGERNASGPRHAQPATPTALSSDQSQPEAWRLSERQQEASGQQQQIDETPMVAGQEEAQAERQQRTTEAPTPTSEQQDTSGQQTSARQAQQFEAEQQQQQQQQQLIAAAGGEQTETESSRIRNGLAENDVLAGDQFTRKTVNGDTELAAKQQQLPPSQKQQVLTVEGEQKTSKSRSLKRAFGGHLGVFGRKRSQAEEIQQQQLLHDQGFGEQTSSLGAQTQSALGGRERHYYYQSTSAQTTARPSSSTRSKLKEADYPDYREILVQPDQGERQTEQQARQAQQYEAQRQRVGGQKSSVEVAAAAAAAAATSAEQAKFEQTQEQEQAQVQVQVSEAEQFGDPADAQQQEIAAAGEQAHSSEGANQPYIRLNNIATINSTGPQNATTGEVKLMRIYVIDLDQKLVVGGSGAGGGQQEQQQQHQEAEQQQQQQQQQEREATSGQYQISYEVSPATSSTAAGHEQQSRVTEAQFDYSTLSATTASAAAATETPNPLGGQDRNHSQPAPVGQQQQERYQVQLPDGYVLLDRDSLQANLSHLLTHMSQYEQPAGRANLTSGAQLYLARANYSQAYLTNYDAHPLVVSMPSAEPQLANQWNLYEQAESAANQGGSVGESGGASFNSSPVGWSGQLQVLYPQQVEPVQQQHQQQFAAVYPQPVQAQVYQSVPQYIAPQFRQQAGQSANPDNEHEWRLQQQQQPQSLPPLPPQQQLLAYQLGSGELSAAPGQPVRYNNNNYTSKAALGSPPAQALPATARQQDKHHANESQHLNVYHQEAAMYQQAADYPGNASSYLAQGEPAQPVQRRPVQQQQQQQQADLNFGSQQQQQHNEPATYKVTRGAEQRWRPLDYSAPASLRRPPQEEQSAPAAIVPAHSYANNRPPINGYRDHDVVSLAKVAPLQQQQEQFAGLGHLQAADLQQASGHIGANLSHSPALDKQHAPLTYEQQQAAKSYQKQASSPGAYANKAHALTYSASEGPSQQVPLLALAHPSSASGLGGPANGTGAPAANPDGQQEPAAEFEAEQQQQQQQQQRAHYALGQRAPAAVTNEYPSLGALKSQAGHAQLDSANYGSAPLSAYGNPRQQQQQQHSYAGRHLAAADQSSAFEAPKIPQPHPSEQANYRQQTYKQQPSSAYLSVAGPPIADGVYDSRDFERPKQGAGRPSRGRAAKTRPGSRQRQPQPQQVEFYADGEPGSLGDELQAEHGQPGYQLEQAPLYQEQQQRRPSQAPRGLLSWETISSVASGAAKRLPSLSSFLSPFAAAGSQRSLYPTANYRPAEAAQQQHKSAHYDRDVSAFHRPYPLRHMSAEQQPGAHLEGQQQADGEAALGAYSSELAGEYAPAHLLNSAASNERPALGLEGQEGASAAAAKGVQVEEEEEELAELGKSYAAPATNSSGVAELIDLAELSGTERELEEEQRAALAGREQLGPKGGGRRRKQTKARPAASKEAPADGSSKGSAGELAAPPRPAAAAAATTQQAARPATQRQRRPRKQKLEASQLGGQLPEQTSLAEHLSSAGANLEARPLKAALQSHSYQQLQQQQQPQPPARRPPIAAETPFVGAEEPLAGFEAGRPGGFGRPMRAPSSLQIGQYRITPQTQFVHSILEPSRQMLGQYFKQYIGQLGQFAG